MMITVPRIFSLPGSRCVSTSWAVFIWGGGSTKALCVKPMFSPFVIFLDKNIFLRAH